ncbi:MAG: DUF3267 domain-containing protein [Candidatus Cloacimonetes bacterium]|nr:DUF3267 domain-containing protein [Candidatus Cloacimonadota bacterium]
MKKKDHSISMLKANLYALPVIVLTIILIVLPYCSLWGRANIKDSFASIYATLIVFFLVLILGTCIHEILHGLSFLIFGKLSLKQIKIGFQWKTVTPYAHCKVPITAGVYRIALIMPTLLLGIIPSIIALITGIGWLMIYGVFFTIVGGGDLLVMWIIRKAKHNQLVQDHPYNCGCYIFED